MNQKTKLLIAECYKQLAASIFQRGVFREEREPVVVGKRAEVARVVHHRVFRGEARFL